MSVACRSPVPQWTEQLTDREEVLTGHVGLTGGTCMTRGSYHRGDRSYRATKRTPHRPEDPPALMNGGYRQLLSSK